MRLRNYLKLRALSRIGNTMEYSALPRGIWPWVAQNAAFILFFHCCKAQQTLVPLSVLVTIINVTVQKWSQGTIFQCFLCPGSYSSSIWFCFNLFIILWFSSLTFTFCSFNRWTSNQSNWKRLDCIVCKYRSWDKSLWTWIAITIYTFMYKHFYITLIFHCSL